MQGSSALAWGPPWPVCASSCVLRHRAVRWHHRPGSTVPDPRRVSGGASWGKLRNVLCKTIAGGCVSKGTSRRSTRTPPCYPAVAGVSLNDGNNLRKVLLSFVIAKSQQLLLFRNLSQENDSRELRNSKYSKRKNHEENMADTTGSAKPKKSLVLNAFVEMCMASRSRRRILH